MTYDGYATTGTGEVRCWQFEVSNTLKLHLHADGTATAWKWGDSCWCKLDVTGSEVVAEAQAMLKALPPAWTSPQAVTINLPIVNREAMGAAEWQAAAQG